LFLHINHHLQSFQHFIICLCPVVPLVLHHSSFFHVIEFSGNVWVWEGGCGQVVGGLIRHLFLGGFEFIEMEILPPSFIDFDSKFLSNNLQLPLLHEKTLFLLSIDHVHSHNLSSVLSIEFPVSSFSVS